MIHLPSRLLSPFQFRLHPSSSCQNSGLCLLDCELLLLSTLLFPFSQWGCLLFILQGWCFLKYFLPYCLAPCCLRFPFSFPSCPLWQLISSPWPFSSVLGRLFSLGRSSFPSTSSVPSLCLDSHTSNPRPHFPLSTTFGEPSSELTPRLPRDTHTLSR